MSQFATAAGFEDLEERKAYSAPSIAELGTLAQQTLGDGTTDVWDMGAGFKKD